MEEQGKTSGAKLSYKEQAYNKLKDAIIFNRFRSGAIYSQDNICKELGISKTPLREALLELQTDGYVSFYKGRGVLIEPVSDQQAREILESRMLMEPVCAQWAAQRADEEDLVNMASYLKELKQKLSTENSQNLYRIDHAFHRAVITAAHNKMLYNFCDVVLNHFLRFEVKSVYNNSIDSHKVYLEHEKVFDAIKEKNAKKAFKAMETHLNNSFHRTLPIYWK